MSVNLLLMKKIFTSLAKNILVPLELTAAVSGTDRAVEKNNFGSGMTTSIIPNKEMEDIMKIVKSLVESGLLTKGVSGAIKKEAKKQRRRFLGSFLGTLFLLLTVSARIKMKKYLKKKN